MHVCHNRVNYFHHALWSCKVIPLLNVSSLLVLLLLLGDMLQRSISPIVSVRMFIYLFIFPLFLINFVSRLSQKFLSLWFSNFHSIFVLIPNRTNKLFRVITQPWRHPGAILWIHVIIHIFITIHPKSTIFTTHKLPAIFQQSDNPHPRARHDAHVKI